MVKNIDLLVSVPADGGWTPVWQMIDLLHQYAGGKLIRIDPQLSQRKRTKILSVIPRYRRKNNRACIVIASDPGIANSALRYFDIYYRYEKVYLWVIDSFWSERIPRFLKKNKIFDKCFVMDSGDISDWKRQIEIPLGVLPWGADVLKINPENLSNKDVDVVRVGRQPEAWSDNQINQKYFTQKSLIYLGSPHIPGGHFKLEEHLEQTLARSKFLLAFNNLSSPAAYTHPTRSYLTSRWVKGISYGAVMLGAIPTSKTALELLPRWVHVEISPTSPKDAVEGITQASEQWDPRLPYALHAYACSVFDWRHRFAEIFSDLGFESPNLEQDIKTLEERSKKLGVDND